MAKKLKIKGINARANSVERWVARWANVNGEGYDDGALGALKDLCYGGCASGMVGDLIYVADIKRFFKRHAEACLEIVAEFESDTGAPIKRDDSQDVITHNVWTAVEIVANRLRDELEAE